MSQTNDDHNTAGGDESKLLPVSLLCGFLGAGKTTMMKHILETKHEEEDFKCAVIVNDMAALNIDKSLIDQSALVQSDEVIAMQNGCFCCTLQSDLVDQIINLAQKNMFNYMLIEASGVSEPSGIAPLFDLCEDDHDPNDHGDHDHDGKPQLGEVARLDTCVTVVDSAEFYNNLESMNTYEQGDTAGTIAELMMEQVDYCNVVVLNKGDLVSEEQTADIVEKIKLIQPRAKIIKTCQSKVDVKDILDTKLYKREKNKDEYWMTAAKTAADEKIESEFLECRERSLAEAGKKCCRSQSREGRFLDSGLSQVQLAVADPNDESKVTRHERRFGISSFIYRARRPFHPGRLSELFLDEFFPEIPDLDDFDVDEEVEEDNEKREYLESLTNDERKQYRIQCLQKEAAEKQKIRKAQIGELLRSKGFVWIATSHEVIGGWQQAGNILRVKAESPWMCVMEESWRGTSSEQSMMKNMMMEGGGEYKYKDRRQELVFIGQSLNHENIQKILDKCLLDDEEMSLGPVMWKVTMADEDYINLDLDLDESEFGDEDLNGEENQMDDDEVTKEFMEDLKAFKEEYKA